MFRDTFVPDLEYTDYMVRDLNFEDYCYRSAIEKKFLHSYVYTDGSKVWFNMSFLPIQSDNDELGYCIYVMEVSTEAAFAMAIVGITGKDEDGNSLPEW